MVSINEFFDSEIDEELEGIPSDYHEQLSTVVEKISDYPEAELKEQLIQELMNLCDDLMEDYQEEADQIPPEFEKLDDLFWDWFQEPPAGEELVEETRRLFKSVIKRMAGGESEIDIETDEDEELEKTEEAEESEAAEEGAETIEIPAEGDQEFRTKISLEPELADDFLTEVNEKLETLDDLLVKIENDPSPETLKVLARAMHTLKGGFGMCDLQVGSNLCHAAEDLLEELKESPPDTVPATWMDLFFASVDCIRLICAQIEDAVEEDSQELKIPLSQEYLTMLKKDLRKACDGVEDAEELESLDQAGAKGAQDSEESEELGEETVNIGMNRIEEIVDLVGELVISNSEIKEKTSKYPDRELDTAVSRQDKILAQLQNRSMKLRMLPLRKEFRKFPRIVRDLARDLDKKINFQVYGGDTEIDKSVLEQLHGPLVHLIRNAVDHGIETPEERRKAGKSETGTVELRAYQEGENIYIEIDEDGAGLDRDGILESAIEKGVVGEEEDLEPEEIDRLIFNPGFSTTDEVSEVSGRGVGMDVVASQIRSMRGNVYIDTEPGHGTKFTIELPLTVAIIEGLIIRLGPDRMILPVSQVEEVLNPEPDELQNVQETGWVLEFREEFIPVIEPGNIMEEVHRVENLDKRSVLVVIDAPQGKFALRVDELVAPEQVVIKSMKGSDEHNSEMVSGAAILGDGSVGLIIDVAGLVHKYHEQDLPPELKSTGKEPVITKE